MRRRTGQEERNPRPGQEEKDWRRGSPTGSRPRARDGGAVGPCVPAPLVVLLAAVLLAALPRPAAARTIILDAATDADRMAGLDESAPRQGWALTALPNPPGQITFTTGGLALLPGRAFLIRYSLARIPPGSRVAHAELLLPVTALSGTDARFYVWRVLADWGLGACHLYRLAWPERKEWARPGARGLSSDRATRPTDIVRLTEAGEVAVNVTDDVDLWHRGAAPNGGWLLTVEDPGTTIQFLSPVWDGGPSWKLRITYEPEGAE